MASIPVVNILPTAAPTASPSAGASNAGQSANDADATGATAASGTAGTAGATTDQGTQGAFGNILAKQIAMAVAQIMKSGDAADTKVDTNANAQIDALLANSKDVPAIDPDALLKQINIDINQLAGNDKPDAGTIDQSLDKLLAADPALAGILKKAKKSGADDVAELDKSQTVTSVIAVGNLPPTLAAATNVTGKDLPKDISISSQVPIATTVTSTIQADQTSATEDKALNAFVNELTTKLAATTTDQTPTQQIPLNVISSAATVNTINSNRVEVSPTVGSQHWDTALGEQVVWIVGTQTQNAELHLNPPSLGPLEIRVSLSDGQANLSFMTQHAAVREALEAATPKLREMMGDSGINMGSVSVNVGTFAQQQQDQAAQQQAASNRNNAANNDFSFGAGTAGSAPAETVTTTVQPLRDLGMVDLFA
jgi:flagellar hook-length control protein FliK